jgi:hypothetical protein
MSRILKGLALPQRIIAESEMVCCGKSCFSGKTRPVHCPSLIERQAAASTSRAKPSLAPVLHTGETP